MERMVPSGRKDEQKMKRIRKITALFLAVLMLAALLAGCSSKQCVWCGKTIRGSGYSTGAGYVCEDCYSSLSGVSAGTAVRSGSNAGVWIAVIVMVFIAVFAATSGVVYLVLQKVLPPERPAGRSRRVQEEEPPRPRRAPVEDFEAPRPRRNTAESYAAPRQTNQTPPRPTANGVWVCPRDKSRNTGPYCAVCGANRPVAPRPAQRPGAVPQQSVSQQNPAPRPTAADQARAAAFAQEASSHINREPAPQPSQQYRVGKFQAPAGRFQAPQQYQPPVQQPEPRQTDAREGFRTAYVRPEQEDFTAVDTDMDVDSELLAAIFREAAKDPEE